VAFQAQEMLLGLHDVDPSADHWCIYGCNRSSGNVPLLKTSTCTDLRARGGGPQHTTRSNY